MYAILDSKSLAEKNIKTSTEASQTAPSISSVHLLAQYTSNNNYGTEPQLNTQQ